MEVAIGSNGSPPFQREVREWQRVDPNTGALLTGRLEADRWITGPQNAYGKVSRRNKCCLISLCGDCGTCKILFLHYVENIFFSLV